MPDNITEKRNGKRTYKRNAHKQRRNRVIAEKRAVGVPMRAIGSEVGLSGGRVCQILQDEEVKALVEQTANRLCQLTPKVYDVYNESLSQDEDKKLRLEAARDIAKISGMAPSNATSIYINKLYQQNNNTIISPQVLDLLKDRNIIDIDLGQGERNESE